MLDKFISAPVFDTRTSLSRRRVIQGAAGVAIGAGLGSAASTAAAASLNPPGSMLQTFRKLRFALHELPVFWWLHATKYGLVDDRLTPLFGLEIASIFRVKDLGPERFSVKSLEFVYTTDYESGELLESYKNPYTGKTVPINDVPVGPTTVLYTADGPTLPTELPGSKLDISHRMSTTQDDQRIWIEDDTSAVVTAVNGDRPPFIVADLATYLGRLDDLSDPNNVNPPATVSFQSAGSWQVRMKMGNHPGNMITRGAGAKVREFEGLPQRFLRLMQRKHPDLYADPIAALDKPAFRFER